MGHVGKLVVAWWVKQIDGLSPHERTSFVQAFKCDFRPMNWTWGNFLVGYKWLVCLQIGWVYSLEVTQRGCNGCIRDRFDEMLQPIEDLALYNSKRWNRNHIVNLNVVVTRLWWWWWYIILCTKWTFSMKAHDLSTMKSKRIYQNIWGPTWCNPFYSSRLDRKYLKAGAIKYTYPQWDFETFKYMITIIEISYYVFAPNPY